MRTWEELFEEQPSQEWPEKRECHTPKCQLCGRFTKRLYLVWTSGPEPEPDYEVGDCCYEAGMRIRP